MIEKPLKCKPPRKTTQKPPTEGSSLRSDLLFYINEIKIPYANKSKTPLTTQVLHRTTVIYKNSTQALPGIISMVFKNLLLVFFKRYHQKSQDIGSKSLYNAIYRDISKQVVTHKISTHLTDLINLVIVVT